MFLFRPLSLVNFVLKNHGQVQEQFSGSRVAFGTTLMSQASIGSENKLPEEGYF